MCRPCGKGVAVYGVDIAAPTSSAGAGVETSALSSNEDGEGAYALAGKVVVAHAHRSMPKIPSIEVLVVQAGSPSSTNLQV